MPDDQEAEAGTLQQLRVLRRRVLELEQQVAGRKPAEQVIANLAKLHAEEPNPVLRISKDCTILYANDASSIVLQTWQRRVGERLPHPCCQRAKESLSRGEVSTFEFTCVDGRIFLVTLAPVAQEGYLNAYGVDITERKKAEASLRESEAKYRDLVEEMTDVIYTIDTQGIVTSVSKAGKAMFGREPQEVIGKTFANWIPPDKLPDAMAVFKRILGGEKITAETVMLDKNGRPHHVEFSSTPIIKDGVVVGTRGIIRDITERKRAEYELQESHKKYWHLVDNITDGVYQIDTKGNFTYVNRVIEERSGIPAEKFVGLNIRDVVIPEYHEIVSANLARSLAGEQVPPFELAYRTATGQTITVETNVRPIYDGYTITGVQGISRDITGRKKAEEKLKESESALRAIIDSVTESVVLMDTNETILAANRTLAERFGTTVDELIGKHGYDFLPDDVAKSRKLQIAKVVRTGEPVMFEDVCGARHILLSINPIKDSTGKVTRLAIFGFDMTEHKRMEEALRESELRYRSLFESSPVGLGLTTADGKILDCNSTMLAMIGYSNAEIRQVNIRDTYVNPGDRARLLKELKTNGLVCDFEAQLKRKDGTTYWANITVIPFPLAGENAILTAQVDITERKQAEEELRESQNILRRIIDILPVRVFWKNKDLEYLGCNEAFVKDAGLKSPDEIVGKNDFELVWKDQAELYRADDKKVIETGRSKLTYEEPSTTLSGDTIWLNTSKVPLKNAEGGTIGVLGVYSDITESKRQERELNLYRDKMTRAEQLASLGALSATLAHEMTQPLTAIRLSIENSLADLQTGNYPNDALEGLKDGLDEVSHAASIIDRLRHFARQSSEKAVSQVNLKEAAEGIVRLLNKNAQQANVFVHLKGLEKLPPIYAHEKDMEQLFFALIDNAIHAGDGKKNRQLTISGTVKGKQIELQFADNCGGIAPENLDKIFEPFFTTKPAGEGTGLGLCIVKNIVSRAGGKVWVKSDLGKGATFFVTLPIPKGMRT
jgi:PAS domain S-box-containing protein